MALTTRDRILRAAIAVVREAGLAGATTRAIAESAGVAEGSIYRNFEDKTDLIRTAITEYLLPDFIELLRSLPSRVGTKTPQAHLRTVATRALAFYRDVLPMWSALSANVELRESFRAHTGGGEIGPHLAISGVARYIDLEQQRGRIPQHIDPKAAAQMLLGSVFQQAFFSQLVGEDHMPLPDDKLVERTVRTLLKG